MIKKLFLLNTILLLNTAAFFPQIDAGRKSLDSLYVNFISSRNQENSSQEELTQNFSEVKCGFGLASEIKHNFERFTPEQQNVLKKLLQRPSKQASMVSPSGFFRIHYDTTGFEVPNYNPALTTEENVKEVAKALDSTYNFGVIFLGYPPPPQDNNEGSDNLYDVYITIPLNASYGSTTPESSLGDQKYTSYMEIHYDFKNFYTKGLSAMRVTVAHEFQHAIQLGSYTGDKTGVDLFFYEMSSTAMEEFVFDDVNDYYAYMPSYFLNPQNAFSDNNGYNLAIWNIYLKDNFGFDVLKKQWELLPTQRALYAINNSLSDKNTSFKHELNQFGVWTYHTKNRAVPGKYFEEAFNYPLIRPLNTIAFSPPNEFITIKSEPAANNFIRFIYPANNDTLDVLITNGDVQSAVSNINQTNSLEYYLYNFPEIGTTKIDSFFYSKFVTKNPSLWILTEISDTIINYIEPQLKTDYPYPMPFSYEKYSDDPSIKIPASTLNAENVSLFVFSTSMQLIFSGEDMQFDSQNKNVIKWQVRNNQGGRVASGIYIYVVKSGDKIEKGKLVILND